MNGKVLIWDLGNTLITADMRRFAREVGLKDFIFYLLVDWKNPTKIHELAFEVLSQSEVEPHDAYLLATASGKVLPAILCHWMSGTISYEQLRTKVDEVLQEWIAAGKFSNKRQQRLVIQTLDVILNPEKLVRCMKPIEETLQLLKECAQQVNEQGEKRHQLFILSNWDAHSFEHLLNAVSIGHIFEHFAQENIVISGHLGTIKPQPAIYQKLIEKFSLDPQQCILLDDQIENIVAAEKHGITGIVVESKNYAPLRKKLETLKII